MAVKTPSPRGNRASPCRILILHGPNLDWLGVREPEIYGTETLEDIQVYTESKIPKNSCELTWFQSAHEGELIEKILQMGQRPGHPPEFDGLVFNPGAYSHTSLAILDALKIIGVPKIEVHLSLTHKRGALRRRRLTVLGHDGVIEGLGKDGLVLGILGILYRLKKI